MEKFGDNRRRRMIIRILLLSMTLFLTSCYYKTDYAPTINSENFVEVLVGDSVSSLKGLLGTPYNVKILDGGISELHYIERLEIYGERTDQINYYFLVKDGEIIDKYFREERENFKLYAE